MPETIKRVYAFDFGHPAVATQAYLALMKKSYPSIFFIVEHDARHQVKVIFRDSVPEDTVRDVASHVEFYFYGFAAASETNVVLVDSPLISQGDFE